MNRTPICICAMDTGGNLVKANPGCGFHCERELHRPMLVCELLTNGFFIECVKRQDVIFLLLSGFTYGNVNLPVPNKEQQRRAAYFFAASQSDFFDFGCEAIFQGANLGWSKNALQSKVTESHSLVALLKRIVDSLHKGVRPIAASCQLHAV
jgi:hypothetical protein